MFGAPPQYTPIAIARADSDGNFFSFIVIVASFIAFLSSIALFVSWLKTYAAGWSRIRGLELAWTMNQERIEEDFSSVDGFDIFFPRGLASDTYTGFKPDKRKRVEHSKRSRRYEVDSSTMGPTTETYRYRIGPRDSEVDSWEEQTTY